MADRNPSAAGCYQEAMRLHEYGECGDNCQFCSTGIISAPVRSHTSKLSSEDLLDQIAHWANQIPEAGPIRALLAKR